MRPAFNYACRLVALSTIAALPIVSSIAHADGEGHDQQAVTVYFTRHAEKKTTTTTVMNSTANTYEAEYDGSEDLDITDLGPTGDSKGSNRNDVCGVDKCAEELSALGLLRRDLLVDWFTANNITSELTAIYSSHKVRTYQTVEAIASAANLEIIQLPADGTELEPEGTTASECPTVEAIMSAPVGSVILVAGHSGTLYDIMGTGVKNCSVSGLGLDTDDNDHFPKDKKGKVANFGDIWKVTIKDGVAEFGYRKNLQPTSLDVVETE